MGVGGANATLDPGETMTFDFGQLATNVTMDVHDIGPPLSAGDVTYSFEAFDTSGGSLGVFAVPAQITTAVTETEDLTARAGGISFAKITFFNIVGPPTGLILEKTSYVTIPEPSTCTLALAALCLAMRRRRPQTTVGHCSALPA